MFGLGSCFVDFPVLQIHLQRICLIRGAAKHRLIVFYHVGSNKEAPPNGYVHTRSSRPPLRQQE